MVRKIRWSDVDKQPSSSRPSGGLQRLQQDDWQVAGDGPLVRREARALRALRRARGDARGRQRRDGAGLRRGPAVAGR